MIARIPLMIRHTAMMQSTMKYWKHNV